MPYPSVTSSARSSGKRSLVSPLQSHPFSCSLCGAQQGGDKWPPPSAWIYPLHEPTWCAVPSVLGLLCANHQHYFPQMAAYPVLVPVYLVEFKVDTGGEAESYTVVCQAATAGVSVLSSYHYSAVRIDALNAEPLHHRRLPCPCPPRPRHHKEVHTPLLTLTLRKGSPGHALLCQPLLQHRHRLARPSFPRRQRPALRPDKRSRSHPRRDPVLREPVLQDPRRGHRCNVRVAHRLGRPPHPAVLRRGVQAQPALDSAGQQGAAIPLVGRQYTGESSRSGELVAMAQSCTDKAPYPALGRMDKSVREMHQVTRPEWLRKWYARPNKKNDGFT